MTYNNARELAEEIEQRVKPWLIEHNPNYGNPGGFRTRSIEGTTNLPDVPPFEVLTFSPPGLSIPRLSEEYAKGFKNKRALFKFLRERSSGYNKEWTYIEKLSTGLQNQGIDEVSKQVLREEISILRLCLSTQYSMRAYYDYPSLSTDIKRWLGKKCKDQKMESADRTYWWDWSSSNRILAANAYSVWTGRSI